MSHHVLHITVEGPTNSTGKYGTIHEFEKFDYSIDCPSTTGFEGWQECTGDHTGFDHDDELSPAFDEEEIEIHGVVHEWKWSHDWTIPYKGCVVSDNDSTSDFVHDIAKVYGPGDYLIEDDWDDYEVTITALSMADGSPLPEKGWFSRHAVVETY